MRKRPYWVCIAIGVLLPGPCPAATTDASAPDQQVVTLLSKLRQQVIADPTNDNAMETWIQVILATAHPSPATTKALDDFVQSVHHDAKAKPSSETAMVSLTIFANLAVAILHAPTDNEHPVIQPDPPQPVSAAAAAYVSRGDAMLAIRDISAARKFYDYAIQAGDGSAAVAKLAQTYDPDFLHRIGALGLQPDVAKAAALYRQAAALGNVTAQQRLRALLP